MKVPAWVRRSLCRWTVACLLPSSLVLALVIVMTEPTRLTFILWGVFLVFFLVVVLAVESVED
jgi:hypothetical protein